jgi:hypothetical protein
VALNTVWVKDDKCSPVEYVSGDTDTNGLLNLTEAWTYRCLKIVSQTETNTATAHGWGAEVGMDVYATAVATVTVTTPISTGLVLGASTSTPPVVSTPTPGFPNTGFPPREKSSPWNVVITVGILAVVTTIAVVLRKRIV